MSSSMRNSLHRRNHKERSQLAHRSRLGFLEKHKDYVLRARDYHSKRDRIQRLRQKAADRNKDEFYFAMNKQKTEKGVHIQDRGNVALPVDIVKVLKTQDENYIRTMRNAGLKKIDKIKEQLTSLANLIKPASVGDTPVDFGNQLDEDEIAVLCDAGVLSNSTSRKRKPTSLKAPKHVIFTEDDSAAKAYVRTRRNSHTAPESMPASPVTSSTVNLGWKSETPKKSKKGKAKAVETEDVDMDDEEDRATISREHRGRLLKELAARLKRDTQLNYAARELEMQRLLMGKGGRQKIRGVEKVEGDDEDEDRSDDDVPSRSHAKSDEQAYRPRVYKWRMERKK